MEPQLPIRYNIAPTNSVAIVRKSNGGRELTTMKWGLIPSWSAEPKMSYSTINAKSEEAAKKPAFRSAMKHRHCLVLADGYYEWATVGKKKFPHLFQLRDQPVFGLAGLWERWDKAEPAVESCTILTTAANELQGKYHNRMPVILAPNDYDTWLSPTNPDPESLRYLFEPYPASEMTDTAVNPYTTRPVTRGRSVSKY
jgi:putative SOS response-associated peptidase YedK